MKVKYRAETGEWLCFMHAVQRAMIDQQIEPVCDEGDFSDYDARVISCDDCRRDS